MELRKNLEAVEESRRDDLPETFNIEHAKMRINECLFEIMPPSTTLSDLDDLATAILMTVQGSWDVAERQKGGA